MPDMQTARDSLSHLLVGLQDIDESVVRGEKKLGEQTYAVAYVDFADKVVERSQHLRDFQERILGDDFFDAPGDLRWNKYLYIVAGPNSRANPNFDAAKAAIEADKDYARKRVVSDSDLESLLGGAKLFEAAERQNSYDVLADWRRRLAAGKLELLLDCITPRTGVVEKIANRSAGEGSDGQQRAKELNRADVPLATSKLLSLTVSRFRPIHDGKTYGFGDVTLVVGANGTGKTSLLEAIEHFYCGYNRRSESSGLVTLKGQLLPAVGGNPYELSSTSDVPRIKARCLAWYNRRLQHKAEAIVDDFSLYNFLDTDAAYRLSANLEPDAVAKELSRLLVGASAATTYDYLEKIRGDVDKAWDKVQRRVTDLQGELTDFQKRLKEAQDKPSTAKTLTETYRVALASIGWRHPLAVGVPRPEEGEQLLAALSHSQALASLGEAARAIKDIEERANELETAVNEAKPLDIRLVELAKLAQGLSKQVEQHEENVRQLDRWMAYESAGFHDVRRRYQAARELSERLSRRLGTLIAGDLPEIPPAYAGLQLQVAVQTSVEAATAAQARLARAKSALDLHGKAASARATVAARLKDAAQEALKTSDNPNACPVCRTVHADGALTQLISELSSGSDTSLEVKNLAEGLRLAEVELAEARKVSAGVEFCHKTAVQLNLDATTPAEVVSEVVALRQQAAVAQAELQRVTKEGLDLRDAGFSSTEADQVLSRMSGLLGEDTVPPTLELASGVRRQQAEAAEEKRKSVAAHRLQTEAAAQSVQAICRRVDLPGWATQVQAINSLASLVAMRDEFGVGSRSVAELRSHVDVASDVPLAEVQARLTAVASAFKQAEQSSRDEAGSSADQKDLPPKIEKWTKDLEQARNEAKALGDAGKVLDDIFTNASLGSATKEALVAIGGQINEVFSRIHSPREYEYVGSNGVLLQSVEKQDPRSLDQVSTGQRAAFALSIFLARNHTATAAPPVLLIDDPIAHIDDLNALSFLDYLRDIAVNSGRQIFFATADTRVASLFTKKFSFLGDAFKTISLVRAPHLDDAVAEG